MPNFLIVGFPKCGTTTLHHHLRKQKDIFLPNKKELHFFNVVGVDEKQLKIELFPYEKDIRKRITKTKWAYQKKFYGARRKKAVGEITPSYGITYERTINNIYKYIEKPETTKIIMILRDPVEACCSHYNMQKNKGIEFLSLKDSINISKLWYKYNHYRRDHVRTFKYARSIKAFQKNFKKVLIILFDDLKNDPQGTLDVIRDFLEVNKTKKMNKIIMYNKGSYKENIVEKQKNEIYNLFKNDIEKTERLINRNLNNWKREY
jgi:hypothetical protein